MTPPIHPHGSHTDRRQWLNLFEVSNRSELETPYRLLTIGGIPAGEHYDKQINLLTKRVSYDLRQPVALVRSNGTHHLAIPAGVGLPILEYPLTPHVATLVPHAEDHVLDFARLDDMTSVVAAAFLRYALRTPLLADRELWGTPRASYDKRPLNSGDHTQVDVYPGFVWNVVVSRAGQVFLSVDTRVRYVDRRWLSERMDGHALGTFRGRFCLYHYGHHWYIVRLAGLTGQSIAQQRFMPEGANQPFDVLAYTRQHCRDNMPAWIRALSPDSPAIVYQYPGNEQLRYGALGLCKLTLSTEDGDAAGLHRFAILDPQERLRRIVAIVARRFQHARLDGRPIRINSDPHEIDRCIFPVPTLRFGHDHVLRVDTSNGAADDTPLRYLGRRRLELATSPAAGPLDTGPFHTQYLILPQSLPRAVNEDFAAHLVDAIRQVSGRSDYQMQRILYDDRGATSLPKQVRAVRDALGRADVTRGYAAVVLPLDARPGLHHFLKRDLWPDVQIKCATAPKILGFYETAQQGEYRPKPSLAGKMKSYVRNCAFGMLIVNRRWLWALETPLHYNVHVGIDVLNGMAGFTCAYDNGRRIRFHNARTTQKERLTSAQIREELLTLLTEELARSGQRTLSVVFQRDGRSFESERSGVRSAFRQLQRAGVVSSDAIFGVVDIRKSTTDHLRIFEGPALSHVANPVIGSHHVFGSSGIVATTGWPFEFPGTANPLSAVLVEGPLRIEWVLEDLFALSQLAFAAPERCQRHPVTVTLNDTFLEPIAGDIDEEAALYDSEGVAQSAEIEVRRQGT